MRDFPTTAYRGREGNQVPPSVVGNDAPKKNHFYAFRAGGSKPDDDEDVGKFMYFSLYCNEILVSWRVR